MVHLAQTDPKYRPWLQEFQYLQDVVKHLSVNGQSSDKDDMQIVEETNIPVFCVKECTWRSKDVTAYMKVIDKMKDHFLKVVEGLIQHHDSESTDNSLPLQCVDFPERCIMWLVQWESEAPEWVKSCLQVLNQPFQLLEIVLK